MNWDQEYLLTKSLVIQNTAADKLVANNSISRKPQELSPHILFVLMSFVESITPTEVLSQLREEGWDIDDNEFETVVTKMVALNFLTPIHNEKEKTEDISLATDGFAPIMSHHYMLKDIFRVFAYRDAIFRHAAAKNVVEIGCGSGILSIFAAKAGARKVVAIEESAIAALAKDMFHSNEYDDIIQLKLANSRDVELDEPADLIIHEIIGVDPFEENILLYIEDARKRFLKENGRFIPYRLDICCVGFEIENKAHVLLEAEEFSSLYGVNFDPFIQWLSEAELEMFRGRQSNNQPKILSTECQVYNINFYEDLTQFPEKKTIHLKIQNGGHLGGIYVYFRAHLDEVSQLTNSPFVQSTHWGKDTRLLSKVLSVNAGDEIPLVVELKTVLGKQKLKIDLDEQS